MLGKKWIHFTLLYFVTYQHIYIFHSLDQYNHSHLQIHSTTSPWLLPLLFDVRQLLPYEVGVEGFALRLQLGVIPVGGQTFWSFKLSGTQHYAS